MGCRYSAAVLDISYVKNQHTVVVRSPESDFINWEPLFHEIEQGTRQWDHRWIDDQGNVIYTNNEEYNPNLDLDLQMNGFKRSPVKKQ